MLALLLLVACPKSVPEPGADGPEAFVGAWEDETGARYIFDLTPSGEVYVAQATFANPPLVVQQSRWEDGALSWAVSAPSNDMVVAQGISTVEGDRAWSTWTNTDGDSGSEVLKRVGAPYEAEALLGTWTSSSGQNLVIEQRGALPTVVSHVDSDGEVLVLKGTRWEGYRLTWDNHKASYQSDVTEWIDGVDGKRLYTSWENAAGGEGVDVYRR